MDILRGLRGYVIPLALAGLALAGLMRGGGPVFLALNLIVLALAAVIAAAFVQRAAFRRRGAAPGVVEITEARVLFMTAGGGEALDRDNLIGAAIEINDDGANWILSQEAGPPLIIPTAAHGADTLSDLVTALPGANLGPAATALAREVPGRHVVWHRLHS